MDTPEIVRRYRGSLGVWLGAVVVLALVFGPGIVDDMGGEAEPLPSGAAVEEAPGDPGNVTVTWTSNQSARYLVVRVGGPASVAGPTEVNGVVLDAVGEQVVFEETGAVGRNQTVTVTVVSVTDDERNVLLETEGRL